ncbi:hypothetical protein OEA41_005526 [Lepraria neglecta]|uniref:MADS-box domain-containing protein n=1 Tax=Lepraria neglecta TaxID=209136 RepID=A0AAE0DJ88_9LECA|nr:hypothetical protein OEA41_005526 [Lepraria neglecta]
MADIADPNASPTAHDDATGNGADVRGVKRPRVSTAADDDDEDDDKPGRERRKIDIKFIQDKSRRHITFSKRKAGIMKKAYELSVLTGTQVLLLVVSETGLVYTFTTPKLQPLVTKPEGKNLIQACLNAPEPAPGNENGVDAESTVDSPEDVNHAQIPAPQASMPRGQGMAPQYMTPEQQQHMAYQQYMQTQQGVGGQYPMPPQGRMQHQPKLEEHMLR